MSNQLPLLESEWVKYKNACYPKGLPVFQETETRQAFYAGCLIVLKFAVEGSASLPEPQAQKFIGGLITEAQTVCRERVYEMKGRN